MGTFAIRMADGSVGIMQTIGDVEPEDCIAKWHPERRANVVSHHPIDPATIPQDRTYRNAWTWTGEKIDHDQAKVTAIKAKTGASK